MADPEDPKAVLRRYLQDARDAVLWKLDGLSERDARLPRTPTGLNLLGIVKHVANVEVVYFGPTFGRPWPTPEELVGEEQYDADPQSDWYATESETMAGVVDLYRRVQAFADETIAELPLDAPGRVPHWRPASADVTLHQVLVHVIVDLTRHAGHADVAREQVDGAVGMLPARTNIPDGTDWEAYTARLTAIAERF